MKICANCLEEKSDESFIKNPDGSFRRHACNSCLGKRERTRLQIDFLDAFNWECSCCKEKDPRFLTLDHVKDNGNKDREKLNCTQVLRLARKEGYPKDSYTCLCFNCNSGRSVNGGICPHKCVDIEQYKQVMKDTQFDLGRSNVAVNTSNLIARVAGRKAQAYESKKERAERLLAGVFTPEQIEQIKLLIPRN